ncbi:MAG: hypothetical protein KIT22_07085 [Verrucomicrobiae bacterium]|nr:hypothetical protein [Verrucomicrobiae bacterium]
MEDALRQVRATEIAPAREATGQKPRVAIENLLLTARVLLVDEPQSTSVPIQAIEEALNQFRSEHGQTGTPVPDAVLAEKFAVLNERLRRLDPQFRSAWHRAVLHDMPWMDRLLPKVEP